MDVSTRTRLRDRFAVSFEQAYVCTYKFTLQIDSRFRRVVQADRPEPLHGHVAFSGFGVRRRRMGRSVQKTRRHDDDDDDQHKRKPPHVGHKFHWQVCDDDDDDRRKKKQKRSGARALFQLFLLHGPDSPGYASGVRVHCNRTNNNYFIIACNARRTRANKRNNNNNIVVGWFF